MKNLSFLTKLYFLAIVIFAVSSCETDEDPFNPTPTDDPAIINLVDEAGFLSEATTLAGGETIRVRLSASQGTNPMNALTIYEDGVKVATDRILVDGSTVGDAAILLLGDDKVSFLKDVEITGADTDGFRLYEFEITDETQLKSSTTLSIETVSGTLGVELVNGSSEVCTTPEQLFTVEITATRGAAALASIAVYEDDVLISDLTRLKYDATLTDFSDNPEPLGVDDANGFTKKILIRTHTSGTKDYRVEVADATGATESIVMTINTGTVTELTGKLLLNRSNPNAGTGGINLLTGASTGTVSGDPTSASAHIRDLGNDGSGNWMRQITSMNGSTLKYPDFTVSENFSYAGVTKAEQITAAYDAGIAFGNSDPVAVGDLFLVQNGDDTFLLEVTIVNDVDNVEDDFIEFNIKY